MMIFKKFPKIPRLSKDIIITEKIDGTNSNIIIGVDEEKYNKLLVLNADIDGYKIDEDLIVNRQDTKDYLIHEEDGYYIYAGSRNRLLTKNNDNYGFCKWVDRNKEELIKLGVGRHFGEWWGNGIQRGYNKKEKSFSLFNTRRWEKDRPNCCDVVYKIYEGLYSEKEINKSIELLVSGGSFVSPNYMNPEGVVIFHKAGGSMFKKMCKNDDKPKG